MRKIERIIDMGKIEKSGMPCNDRHTCGTQKMIALGFKELMHTEDKELVLDFLEQLKISIVRHYDKKEIEKKEGFVAYWDIVNT